MPQSTPIPTQASSPRLRVVRDEDAPAYDGIPDTRTRTEPFVMVPVEVGRAILQTLGPSAFAVYWHLASRAKDGKCWPSLDDIAEGTSLSRMHVTRMLAALETDQWITRTKRTGIRGMTTSTLYTILEIPCTDACNTPVTSREHDPLLNVTGTRLELDVNQKTVNTPLPPKEAIDFDDEFWPHYPKGRGSKADARKLWSKLSLADQRAAVDALPMFAAGRDWQRGFHTGPEVWLRGRRWENPPEPYINGQAPPGADKFQHVWDRLNGQAAEDENVLDITEFQR